MCLIITSLNALFKLKNYLDTLASLRVLGTLGENSVKMQSSILALILSSLFSTLKLNY